MWRIIDSPPHDGAMNMAIDEAILETVRAGESPPTLRFYTWDPPCVSIGYFQRTARSVVPQRLAELGYEFVRRPTGGRAILHDDELTYSIVAPISEIAQHGPGRSVLDTYLAISRGLCAGLRLLGIPADIAPRDAYRRRSPRDSGAADPEDRPEDRREDRTGPHAPAGSAACFDTPSSYELTVGGRKIVGSAQTRRGDTLLQHGSIPFSMDYAQVEAVMGLSSAAAEDLRRGVATVNEFLGENPSPHGLGWLSQLKTAICDGLTSELMKEALPGELSQAELTIANELILKYRSDGWNSSR